MDENIMLGELTDERKLRVLDIAFMGDKEYYDRYLSELSQEQFDRFLEMCPEFLEEVDWDTKQ